MSREEFSDRLYDFINGVINDLNDVDIDDYDINEEALDFCESALSRIQEFICELDKESKIYGN